MFKQLKSILCHSLTYLFIRYQSAYVSILVPLCKIEMNHIIHCSLTFHLDLRCLSA